MLERHELSALWGDSPDQEYQQLVEDMKENGYVGGKITLLDGKVLDGWHRMTAAQDAGIELFSKAKGKEGQVGLKFEFFQEFEKVYPNVDPVDYVISLNARRRHLTPKQRARGVLEARKWGDPEYKAKTHEELAAEAGVSESTLHREKAALRAERGEATPAHGTSKTQKDIEDDTKPGEGGERLTTGEERRDPAGDLVDAKGTAELVTELRAERDKLAAKVLELEASEKVEYVKALETALNVEKKKVLDLTKQVDALKAQAKKVERAKRDLELASDVKLALETALNGLRTPAGWCRRAGSPVPCGARRSARRWRPARLARESSTRPSSTRSRTSWTAPRRPAAGAQKTRCGRPDSWPPRSSSSPSWRTSTSERQRQRAGRYRAPRPHHPVRTLHSPRDSSPHRR